MKRTFIVGTLATLASIAFAASVSATPPDPWITTKAKVALLASADVDGLGIDVDTVDGPPSDEEIEKRAEQALNDDAALARSDIDVASVGNGIVTLEGKAESMTAHQRALERVRAVEGVAGVRTRVVAPGTLRDEDVDPSSTPAARIEKTGRAAEPSSGRSATSDMRITIATKVKLIANEKTPALDINVDTVDGEVTLFGIVPTEAAKAAAADEARTVDGVTKVHNDLEIVPSQMKKAVQREDGELKTEIETRIEMNENLKDDDIVVEISNGVARLTGTVDSSSDRLEALTAARGVAGVRSAIDDLTLGDGSVER